MNIEKKVDQIWRKIAEDMKITCEQEMSAAFSYYIWAFFSEF